MRAPLQAELHGTVVGAVNVRPDGAGAHAAKERARGQPVVQPPPDVLLAGGAAGAHGPPGVAAGAFVELAEHVDDVGVDVVVEAGSLLVGEAGVFAVGLGVGQVDLLVGAVEVAADEHGLGPLQVLDVGEEGLVPSEPVGQAHKPGLRVGGVDVDEVEVRELGGDHPALGVVFLDAHAQGVRQDRLAGENEGAGVAFFHRAVPEGLVAGEPGEVHLLGGGLGFLQADHVGIALEHVVAKAFVHCRADAVDVPGGKLHGKRKMCAPGEK